MSQAEWSSSRGCRILRFGCDPAGIPKLADANNAGGRNSDQCTLILTEGDSAATLAIAGLSVVGRDNFGVFPLRWESTQTASCLRHTTVLATLPLGCRGICAGPGLQSAWPGH